MHRQMWAWGGPLADLPSRSNVALPRVTKGPHSGPNKRPLPPSSALYPPCFPRLFNERIPISPSLFPPANNPLLLPGGSMAASHRFARAPPPTPIATGKGHRSAAVDDRVLADFLENLKIPNLALPDSVFLAARSPKRIPADIDLPFLIAGDEASVRRVLAAAAAVGTFRIDGRDVVPADEVRSAIEIGGAIFGIPDSKKRELGGRFRQLEGIGEEFYWCRRMSTETERILEEAWPGTYSTFREKMDNVASKLEMVAQCIKQILSKHVTNERHSTGIDTMRSLLCLKKYDSQHIVGDRSECDGAKHRQFHALSLHLSSDDHDYRTRSPMDSAYFTMPSSSILVTIGEQLQEWCSGGFKSDVGEVVFKTSNALNPSISLEFVCPAVALTRDVNGSSAKIITIIDQLLLVFALAFFYKLWACLSFNFIT